MKKAIAFVIFAVAASAAFCGVPVKWSVETSRADERVIDVYHGESLDIEVTFKSYGQVLELPTNEVAATFWQTNGMASAYWRTNNVEIVASNGIMRTTFGPEQDVGAKTLRGFIGIAGQIYRAAFVLRFKDAPGYNPAIVEWPFKLLDFETIEIRNPPYFSKEETEEKIAAATNKLDEVYSGWIDEHTDEQGVIENAKVSMWAYTLGSPADEVGFGVADIISMTDQVYQASKDYTDGIVPEWAKNPTKPAYTADEVGAFPATKNSGSIVTYSADKELNWKSKQGNTNRIVSAAKGSLSVSEYTDGFDYLELLAMRPYGFVYQVLNLGQMSLSEYDIRYQKKSGTVAMLDDVPSTNGFISAESDPSFSTWKNGLSIQAGSGASAHSTQGIAIGNTAGAGILGTAIGPGAKAKNGAAGRSGTAVGAAAKAYTDYSGAFGYGALANGAYSISIGNTRSDYEGEVSIGLGATSHGVRNFNIGADSMSKVWLGSTNLDTFVGMKVAEGVEEATSGFITEESDPNVPEWAKAETKPTYTASEVGATTAADVYRLVAGTNVVLVVTNYNSATHAAAMKLQHLDPELGQYVTYWDEMRQHEITYSKGTNYTDAAIAERAAPRAWSGTTSGLGSEAPAGVTWISTPETVIAGGFEYEKVVTSAGAVWVLTSNGMSTGATSNSFFRVAASDGTELFSIEKTDSYLIGVNADGITRSGNTVTIPINVVAAEHPYIRCTKNLVNPTWVKEDEGGLDCAWATVSWGGTTGAYVATVTTAEPQAFFYFEYMVEGQVKIKNSAKTEMSGGILFNGTTYLPTVNGNKLEFVAQ